MCGAAEVFLSSSLLSKGVCEKKKKKKLHEQLLQEVFMLTAHNWQKWERVFLICPCHEIYRDEAVGLKSCKYTWK